MKYLILLSLVFWSGCGASIRKMKGNAARFVRGERVAKLNITAEVDKRASLENYRLINLYFQNLNEDWVRVKSVEVVSLQGDQNYKVILGRDLKAWIQSMKLDEDLRKEFPKEKQLKPMKGYSPEDHVYKPFSMPSKLQTKKWVLLQVTNDQGHRMELKFNFINGDTQYVKVDLK